MIGRTNELYSAHGTLTIVHFCLLSLFESEVKCKTSDMKTGFIFKRVKTHDHFQCTVRVLDMLKHGYLVYHLFVGYKVYYVPFNFGYIPPPPPLPLPSADAAFSYFRMGGYTLSLAFKQSLKGTRSWPLAFPAYHFDTKEQYSSRKRVGWTFSYVCSIFVPPPPPPQPRLGAIVSWNKGKVYYEH